MSTPLQSYLSYKLSGIEVTDDRLEQPVCRLCENQGRADEILHISAGDEVYACVWWKALVGWNLLGIYHATHSLSDIVEPDPPRPTAIFRAVLERGDSNSRPHPSPESYTLTDLSLTSVQYPDSLEN